MKHCNITPALIIVDWGTSAFRAYLVGSSGQLIDKKSAPLGLQKIPIGGCEASLNSQLKDWLEAHPSVPLVMAGMVGSKQGWLETPYVSVPVTLDGLAGNFVSVPWHDERRVLIVPGIDTLAHNVSQDYDVIRGEETQIFGALSLIDDQVTGTRRFCLPGTHSKWVCVKGGAVVTFRTHMTGELFELLCENSLLAKSMSGREFFPESFVSGVNKARTSPRATANFANLAFSVRTLALSGKLSEEQLFSYLSGLMIGLELISEATEGEHITLIGSKSLCDCYRLAAETLGIDTQTIDAERATVAGIIALMEIEQ